MTLCLKNLKKNKYVPVAPKSMELGAWSIKRFAHVTFTSRLNFKILFIIMSKARPKAERSLGNWVGKEKNE